MENLIIKENEVKEPGWLGKTVYVIKNNEIREPGLLGRTVYVIKGNEIKEPGFLGKTVYIIDGGTIKKPGIFGGAFLGETVATVKSNKVSYTPKPGVETELKSVEKTEESIEEKKVQYNSTSNVAILDTTVSETVCVQKERSKTTDKIVNVLIALTIFLLVITIAWLVIEIVDFEWMKGIYINYSSGKETLKWMEKYILTIWGAVGVEVLFLGLFIWIKVKRRKK